MCVLGPIVYKHVNLFKYRYTVITVSLNHTVGQEEGSHEVGTGTGSTEDLLKTRSESNEGLCEAVIIIPTR